MKKKMLLVVFIWFTYFNTNSQKIEQLPQKIRSLGQLEQRRQKLFDIAFSNQDTVKNLIEIKKKPKTVIVEKIKYIKIYKTVPVYLPESEYLRYEQGDTLENEYIVPPNIKLIPNIKKRKKFLGIF